MAAPSKPLFSNQSLFDDLLAPSSPSSLTDARPTGNGQHSDKESSGPVELQSSSPALPHSTSSGHLSHQAQPEPAPVSAKPEAEAEKDVIKPADAASVPADQAPAKKAEPATALQQISDQDASAPTVAKTFQQSSGQPHAKPSVSPASKHVATLRETKAFASPQTSGLTTRNSSENTILHLDLTAPQPGGESSLCPAKVEIERVAALDFPLHNSVVKLHSSNPSNDDQLIAEVPAPQVANLGANIIAYAMKKARIRVLDCLTGDRLLLQAEGGGVIQSINASHQLGRDSSESNWLISAISQPRSAAEQTLSIWSITQRNTRLSSELLQSTDLAQEARKHGVLLSCDWSKRATHGEISALLSSAGPSNITPTYAFFRVNPSEKSVRLHDVVPKGSISDSKVDSQIVASTLSTDGRVAAFLARAADDGPIELVVKSDDGNSISAPFTDLPSGVGNSHSATSVSYMEFVGPPADGTQPGLDCPRALLVGFQSNAILGLYDLQDRAWRFVWKFEGPPSEIAFNVVRFHRQGSSILVANSARASVMIIELKFDVLSKRSGDTTTDSTSIFNRLKNRGLPWTVQAAPCVSESALQEPIISFSVADGKPSGTSNAVKLFASFSSGTSTVSIPFTPSQGKYLTCSPAPAKPPVAGGKSAGALLTSSDSDGADPVAPVKSGAKAKGLQGLLSSDSDLDLPRTALKPQPPRFPVGVREKESPAEWDADTHTFSQLVSSGTSSGRNSPAPARAPQKLTSSIDTSSPKTGIAKGKNKVDQISSEARRGAGAGSSRPREASHKETVQPKTILSRSAPGESTTNAGDVGNVALHEAIKNLESKLSEINLDAAKVRESSSSVSSGQLSAAALSAIASEVSALVSSELGSSIAPQMVDAVRDVAERSLREALSKDLRGVLPSELKKILGRSDVSDMLTKSISQAVLPVVQKTAMDVVSRVLAPHFEEAIAGLSRLFEAQVKSSMHALRADVIADQSAGSKATEQQLQRVTTTLSSVLESVESLTKQNEALHASLKELKASEARKINGAGDLPLALAPRPPATPAPLQYGHHHYGYTAPHQARYPSGPWHPVEPFHSPMMSHQHLPHRPSTSQRAFAPFGGSSTPLSGYASGAGPPPPPSIGAAAYPVGPPTPSVAETQQQSVEDALLGALTLQDKSEVDSEVQLSNLLARLGAQYNRPEGALQGGGAGGAAMNQVVLLTLLHRLAAMVGSQRGIIPLETAIPWSEAAIALLKVDDGTIAAAYANVSAFIREAFLSAWQRAQGSGTAPWWTEDRLQNYLLRHLK